MVLGEGEPNWTMAAVGAGLIVISIYYQNSTFKKFPAQFSLYYLRSL